MSECFHKTHLDLVHFTVARMPILVAVPISDPTDPPPCEAASVEAMTVQGEEFFLSHGLECEGDAWVEVGLPARLSGEEEEASSMAVANLCRNHLALLILSSEDLVEEVEE